MKRRFVLLPVLALSGCGAGAAHPGPAISTLPLVPGAVVRLSSPDCDLGTGGYCATEAVIVATGYGSSQRLFAAEERRLARAGWSLTNGYTGNEHGAESPGHHVRVTYATADQDLRGIDFGWIRRPRAITLALDHTLYDRTPALSVMLETGSA